MRKKKKQKFNLKEFLKDAWLDLKFKLIILGSVFIAFVIVILLVVNDMQADRQILEQKANKYDTYIDQLLLKKFSADDLRAMNNDELKLAIDMVIDEENNRVADAPALHDFILPVKDEDYTTMFKLTRPPKKEWSDDDIKEFWIDIDSLDIESLNEKNFDFLKARLEDIR